VSIEALLDSNVVIAAIIEGHEHHAASLTLMTGASREAFAIAAHSFAETYNTLTRRGELGPYRFSPREAWPALEAIRAMTALIGLTPAQTFEAVGAYAQSGGIGARIYDRLIGEVAVVHRIPVIVTWNVGQMRNLFPDLTVVTPKEFSKTSRG